MNNKTNFIFEHWEIINFSILGLAVITVIVALLQKDSLKMKIINVVAIMFLPIAGIIYFFARMIVNRTNKI